MSSLGGNSLVKLRAFYCSLGEESELKVCRNLSRVSNIMIKAHLSTSICTPPSSSFRTDRLSLCVICGHFTNSCCISIPQLSLRSENYLFRQDREDLDQGMRLLFLPCLVVILILMMVMMVVWVALLTTFPSDLSLVHGFILHNAILPKISRASSVLSRLHLFRSRRWGVPSFRRSLSALAPVVRFFEDNPGSGA